MYYRQIPRYPTELGKQFSREGGGISNNVPRDLGMQFPGNWGKLFPGACDSSLAREWGRQFSRE